MSWLADASGDSGNHHIDRDGQQGGEDSGEGVLGTSVLWHSDELLNNPANEVVPAKSRGKGETRNNRIEGLCFEFLSHEVDSINRGVHGE